MNLKWILPLTVAALVAFVAVPAMACGGARTSNETITASTDGAEPAAAEPAAEQPAAEEPAAEASTCGCAHARQAEAEQADEAETDTELTNTQPADSGYTCPHAVEAAAADDDTQS